MLATQRRIALVHEVMLSNQELFRIDRQQNQVRELLYDHPFVDDL
jgi:hypothetical protein